YIIGGTDLGPIGDGKDIQAEYYLCDPAGVDGVRKEVSGGRELNATSTVEYGMVGESELNKSVLNRCSADPDTGLGGGIRVADVYDAIVAACAP
ncbi:MAG: hypothetical protein OEM59_19080, partial [Rhodospirillales bacterium]|nr:hypothetical protein [Rhodospirillales bacterium]